MPELKPCPCCGSTDIKFISLTQENIDMSLITCNNCGIMASALQTKPNDPVTVWNKRFNENLLA